MEKHLKYILIYSVAAASFKRVNVNLFKAVYTFVEMHKCEEMHLL